MTFKDRLARLRTRKGLSQNEIATRLGIARTTYSGYENGSREPDIEMINKIADFHGVSTDWLLGNEIKNKNESAFALSESDLELFIKEEEEKYGVTLRDDPVVIASFRQLIHSIAQTKVSQQKSRNHE